MEHAVPEKWPRTDRQTDRQTDTVITIILLSGRCKSVKYRVDGGPKKLYIFQHTISLELFKIK